MRSLFGVTILFLTLACSSAGAMTLKIATIAPEGTAWVTQMRAAGKKIHQETQGRVKLKFYPGGVMGNESSVLRKMRIGQLHGGAFTAGSLSKLYPDIQIYSLPMLFKDFEEVNYVRKRIDPKLKQGLAKKGLVALGITDAGFAYIMSNTNVAAIKDLKTRKPWVPEGDVLSRSIYESAHLSPVSLPISDVYTGLQTGLINTIAGPPVAALAFQWHTRIKHLTNVPIMYLTGVFVVSQKAMKRLSADDRKTVEMIIGQTMQELDHASQRDHKKALTALKQQHIQFDTPNVDELGEWQHIAKQAIVNLGRSGIYSQEMFDRIQNLLETYRANRMMVESGLHDS